MTNLFGRSFQAVLLALALTACPLSAGVLVTTLGPGGAYEINGYDLGESGIFNQSLATPFSLAAPAVVADALVAIGALGGPYNPVNLFIALDNGSQPGAIVATLTQVGNAPPYFGPTQLLMFTCGGPGCSLASGSYWLIATADFAAVYAWHKGYQSPAGVLAVSDIVGPVGSSTGPWDLQNDSRLAFQLDSAVPEPASILLLASGLLGLLALRARS